MKPLTASLVLFANCVKHSLRQINIYRFKRFRPLHRLLAPK